MEMFKNMKFAYSLFYALRAFLVLGQNIAYNGQSYGEVGRDGPTGPPDGMPATEPVTEGGLSRPT